jgi:hypothetical protein
MQKLVPKYYYFLLPLILLLIGCPRSQLREAGLREQANEELRQGQITEAINTQVSAIGAEENCEENQREFPPTEETVFTRELPLERRRPKRGNSARENASICRRRAQVASSRGINKLVISFEGLGTYNDSFTNNFYDYYDDLWNGDPRRRLTGMGSNVGRDLITPNLHEDYRHADFLLLSENDGANTIEECVEIYRDIIGPSLDLNIVGLSFGAGEALVLAERLNEKTQYGSRGIIVNNLLTVDLRGTERVNGVRTRMNGDFQTPSNVTRHMNFGRFNAMEPLYVSPRFGYPGYRSRGSGDEQSITVNHPMPTSAGHATQLRTDVIQNYYREML